MRLLTTTAIVLVLGTAGALAADAPDLIIDEPAIEMATDWTGAYVGVGVSGLLQSNGPQQIIGIDGYLGFNVQADMFLFGAEAYLSGRFSNIVPQYFAIGAEGRVGVLATDAVLLYGALGLEHSFASGNQYLTAGGGVEFLLAESLSLDLEYKHYFPITGTWVGDGVFASLNWHF